MSDSDVEDKSQKTEEPSERRKQKAKESGQLAISKEFSAWVVMLAAMVVLFILGPSFMNTLKNLLLQFFEKNHELMVDDKSTITLFKALFWQMIKILSVPTFIFVGFVLVGGFIQTGGNISFEKLQPKLSKISILKGFERLFSWKGVMEMIKAVVKIIVIGCIAGYFILEQVHNVTTLQSISIPEFYPVIGKISQKIFTGVLSVITLLVIGDYLMQRFNLMKELRMSKKEVKDEHKESEGDPHIKQKIRQIRRDRLQQNLSQAVPEASVILTNPTHYSVALRYVSAEMEAPVVVAKGQDHQAFRIREIAKEHDISIVENKPLARALYDTVEVNEEIPVEYYDAVADVIRYLMKYEKKTF